MNKIILHAEDLDGFLTEEDKINIQDVHALYDKSLDACTKIDKDPQDEAAKDELSDSAAEIGAKLKEICSSNDRIHVYSFETPREQHGEASRIIAKLRNPETGHEEFLYYIQRAYELMFAHSFADKNLNNKRAMIQMTPVTNPVRNYAVHKIPDVDELAHSSVMCVMLRGALLPSMIISK